MDGDGKCDYLWVDNNTGAITMIRNDYSNVTDTFAWTLVGEIAGPSCTPGYGPGLFDLTVQFAKVFGMCVCSQRRRLSFR